MGGTFGNDDMTRIMSLTSSILYFGQNVFGTNCSRIRNMIVSSRAFTDTIIRSTAPCWAVAPIVLSAFPISDPVFAAFSHKKISLIEKHVFAFLAFPKLKRHYKSREQINKETIDQTNEEDQTNT